MAQSPFLIPIVRPPPPPPPPHVNSLTSSNHTHAFHVLLPWESVQRLATLCSSAVLSLLFVFAPLASSDWIKILFVSYEMADSTHTVQISANTTIIKYAQKVAIVGAGGNCGRFITEALLKTGLHFITAITREDSTSTFPSGVQIAKVNYSDPSSLVSALRDQDALIITMGVQAPKDQEEKLVEAAAEANVQWIVLNEWSPDLANESLSNDMFIGQAKKEIREKVEDLGKSKWIAVSTGFWYEFSLAVPLAYGFDFEQKTVTLYDEGTTKICTSTWPQVGRAVASLLSLPIDRSEPDDSKTPNGASLQDFKNDYVYISSFTVSQMDILQSVLRVTHTSLHEWTVTKEQVKQRYQEGVKSMKNGDRSGFVKMLYARVFYPDGSGNVEQSKGLQNEVLKLPKEDLDTFTNIAIERAKQEAADRRLSNFSSDHHT